MRIIVNNIAASSGGALAILKSFHSYLIETGLGKEHEWIFLLNDRHVEEAENIRVLVLEEVKKNWGNRLIFDLFIGKVFINKLKPDIVFSMQNTIVFGLNCKQVLYMHQSLPFQKIKKFSFLKREERVLAVYQHLIGKLIKKSIKKSDMTVVQTKWIKDAVIQFTNIASHKIVDVFPPQEDYSKYRKSSLAINENFFYPASGNLYKNHECIYKACAILQERGITNYNIALTIDKKDTLYPNIIYMGEIPFEMVLEKYNNSTLIFPSYIETLGLPLLEARQMGTRILASDCPYSREVLNDYENAYFFNPFRPQELADLMENILSGIIRIDETKKNLNMGTKFGWGIVLEILENIGNYKK
ncbi:glycosyltransferase [Paenibacillus odorifer]|uniref:Glycosyl transferase family 1 domain-containing protein n=1 Tax=Paenibacillus odorifer TaxID=189426 RepID=A0ABX3GIR9_9BACL|nr:glycosyltransferase [Paenibacillus odorifer]OMD21919.1 hypothetical protein BSO21_23270 [Paenibacillus odorifer]